MENRITSHIVVAGGGSWGTALAHVLASASHEVTMLVRSEEAAVHIREKHENPRYLAGKKLHFLVSATSDERVLERCSLFVLAVPCQHQRVFLSGVKNYLPSDAVIVNAAKGLETGTSLRMSEVAGEVMPEFSSRYAVLSGPSFAAEVMDGSPTAVVLGCADDSLGAELRSVFSTPYFRCYSSTDVMGVEMGGALKNVMAISAGVCDGLGLGDNSRAALISRGLAELSRIGCGMGAHPATFMGLSGLGDLILTCTGNLSRNRQVGLRLGQGESLQQIIDSLGMVAEGVATSFEARSLAEKLGVEAPITEAVCRILEGKISARRVVLDLMNRALKEE